MLYLDGVPMLYFLKKQFPGPPNETIICLKKYHLTAMSITHFIIINMIVHIGKRCVPNYTVLILGLHFAIDVTVWAPFCHYNYECFESE